MPLRHPRVVGTIVAALALCSRAPAVTRSETLLARAVNSAQAQAAAITFRVPIERDAHSGDTHDYTFAAAAGDLITGTVAVRTVAAILDVRNGAGAVVHTDYFFPDEHPAPRRIGFVASAAGTYHLHVRAFNRFDGGPAW